MLRLSRLSRARASLNVRYTTPGHANPYFLDRAHFIDPSHPAAKLALRNLPAFVCPQFTIRTFPNAILHEPLDFVPINPLLATGLVRARTHTHARQKWWSNLTEPSTFHEKEGHRRSDTRRRHLKFIAARQLADVRVAALAARGRRNVSLLFHTAKKATSKSCVIRRRLRSKITAAIGLVVSRNADTVHAPESDKPRPATPYPPLHLVSRSPQEGEPLVLQDWTYLVIPDLAIYKMPLPNLVQAVRKALLSLSHQSKRLEASWSALPKRKPRSPQRPSVDRQLPSVHSPLHHPHKVGDKPQSAIRTRTLHPRASERVQGSDMPRGPARHSSIPTRLYSDRPVILPHEKPKA